MHRVQRYEILCSIARRLILKGAGPADKINQMTIKYAGIQGVNNLCVTSRALRTSIHSCLLCGCRKPGNCSVRARAQLLESGSLEFKSLPSNLLAPSSQWNVLDACSMHVGHTTDGPASPAWFLIYQVQVYRNTDTLKICKSTAWKSLGKIIQNNVLSPWVREV